MAVEIPVVVDILGGIDDAIKTQLPKAMQNMQVALSKNALRLKFHVDDSNIGTLDTILKDTSLTADNLARALKDVNDQISKKVGGGAKFEGSNVSNKNQALLQARNALQQRYNVLLEIESANKRKQSETIKDNTNNIKEENSELSKQGGILKNLTSALGGYLSLRTLVRFVKQVRDVTGELEYQRVALGHLLQDEAFGNELFAKTIEAAKESPFRIGQLVTYTKQLAAYRIEQENLFDTTQRLADISAGLGVDMNRLILAYGQVRAASVLRGQELRQFTEAGIPLVELLAEKFRKLGREGTTTADVFKLISERAVPFEYIKEIFEELTNAGGQFYKMQETQAKTLRGRWEKLKDAYDQALSRVGETDTFQSMNDTVLGILNGLANNLERVVRLVNSASIAWIAYWAATKSGLSYGVRLTAMFVKEYGAVTTLKFGVAGLTASFKKLFAVLKANWVGLAVAVASGLVTWFTTFKSKTKEAEEGLSDMQKAIERMKDANKEFEYGKGLVASYEELAKKTDRTARESERMLDTLNELERTFPGLTEKINNDNLSLEERIGLMREAVNAGHNLAVQEAKNRLNTQNEIIRGLEDQEKAARLVKESTQRRLEAAQTAEKVGPVPIEQRYGPGIYDTAEDLKNKTIEAAKAAKEADDAYEDIAIKLATARDEAKQLKKLAFPEDAKKDMAEWQQLLLDARKYTSEGLQKELFTETDIKSWDSLGEAIKKLKPQFKEAKETYEGLVSAVKEGGRLVRPELVKERDSAKDAFDAWSLLNTLLGGLLTAKGSGGGGYTQDPFIKQMQDRIKFMQDFQKGYEDLSKYMSKAGALGKESDVMLTRGLSLGIDASEQKRAAEELSEWYKDMINQVFGKLQREKGVSGSLQDFLSRQITGNANRDKMLRDYQSLLQSLFDAQTDFDIAKEKQKLEDSLKKLSDEIKRSETARNFYKNILDLTGDEELAATMSVNVYGGIGEEFKERMQEQLNAALEQLDASAITDDLRKAFANQDFPTILANLDKFPKEWQSVLKQLSSDNEKYNADWISNLIKTYQKDKDYEERITDIRKREEQKRKEISESSTLSDEQKATYTEASKTKEARDVADVELEALKNTYEWTQAFKDMERVSTDTLNGLIRLLDTYIKKSGADASPEALKAVTQAREQAQEQLVVRNSYRGAVDGLKNYIEAKKEASRLEKEGKKDTLEYKKAQDKARDALKDTDVAIQAIGESFNTLSSIVSSVSDILDLDELSDGKAVLSGIATGISLIGTALMFVNAVMTMLKTDPVVLAISAIIAAIASVSSVISNLKTSRLDRQIKTQQEHLDALAYSYDRLGKAMEKSFGSDYIYNYNKQLEILAAQQAAYNEQARLEREKGKKADEDKIKDYENSARDAADQIADMRTQLSEFFSGTDLTSAAEDFANAWIEAYKEFGSTTDAMSEKFNEMIENMINKSLAAKIMQEMLQPIFDQIDLLAKDGLLSTEDISSIAALAQERIPLINDAMTNLMTNLASAGLDVRNSTVGLKGISKEIAGASEESILALAAGINTQNFYMSYMPTISENVSAILAAMTGGVNPTASVLTNENGDIIPSVQQMVYDHLPNVDNNISEMLRLFRSVVTTKNSSTNTAYIAIR